MMAYRDCQIAMLDWARIGAVMLVVANHTSPLIGISEMADFWLTRICSATCSAVFPHDYGIFSCRLYDVAPIGSDKKTHYALWSERDVVLAPQLLCKAF